MFAGPVAQTKVEQHMECDKRFYTDCLGSPDGYGIKDLNNEPPENDRLTKD